MEPLALICGSFLNQRVLGSLAELPAGFSKGVTGDSQPTAFIHATLARASTHSECSLRTKVAHTNKHKENRERERERDRPRGERERERMTARQRDRERERQTEREREGERARESATACLCMRLRVHIVCPLRYTRCEYEKSTNKPSPTYVQI